jgi:hypothetical protein
LCGSQVHMTRPSRLSPQFGTLGISNRQADNLLARHCPSTHFAFKHTFICLLPFTFHSLNMSHEPFNCDTESAVRLRIGTCAPPWRMSTLRTCGENRCKFQRKQTRVMGCSTLLSNAHTSVRDQRNVFQFRIPLSIITSRQEMGMTQNIDRQRK